MALRRLTLALRPRIATTPHRAYLHASTAVSMPPRDRGGSGGRDMKKKGKGDEAAFFTKREQAALQKILAKVKAQADDTEPVQAEKEDYGERDRLRKILAKGGAAGAKVDEATLDRLLEWKHEPAREFVKKRAGPSQ